MVQNPGSYVGKTLGWRYSSDNSICQQVNPVPHPIDLNIASFSELKTLYHELGGDHGNGGYIKDYTS